MNPDGTPSDFQLFFGGNKFSPDMVTCDQCGGEGRCDCPFHQPGDQRCPFCKGFGLRKVPPTVKAMTIRT